jgi:hypothetical protein
MNRIRVETGVFTPRTISPGATVVVDYSWQLMTGRFREQGPSVMEGVVGESHVHHTVMRQLRFRV